MARALERLFGPGDLSTFGCSQIDFCLTFLGLSRGLMGERTQFGTLICVEQLEGTIADIMEMFVY